MTNTDCPNLFPNVVDNLDSYAIFMHMFITTMTDRHDAALERYG
jgi:hypothetical protein